MNNCKICVVDDSFPNFELDKDGICNYCNLHFEMEKDMPNDHRGMEIINKKVKEIKNRNKNNKYDVVLGVSGGRDPTYLLYYSKKYWDLDV